MNDEVNAEAEQESPEQDLSGAGEDSTVGDDVAIEKLQEENALLVDQLQRARAELANFRRRTTEQQAVRERRTTSSVFQQVVPLMDDLQMALSAGDTDGASDVAQLRQGLVLIQDKFVAVLRDFGIEAIPTIGEEFDPNWHEALMHQETTDQPEGRIVSEFVRGYRMGDDLIRAARVAVAKAPAGDASPSEQSSE